MRIVKIVEQHDESRCAKKHGLICNADTFLFFYDNQFILLIYNRCLESYSHLDFKEKVFKSLQDSMKVETSEVTRSHDYDRDLKQFRLKGIEFETTTAEVNYLYYDNAMKSYAFSRDVNWFDIDMGKIKESYLKMREYLTKYSDYWLDSLEELYLANYIIEPSQKEMIMNINELNKQLNKQLSKL